MFGEDDPQALAKLWDQISRICRLDAGDPVQAWRERSEELERVAQRLHAAELDSLHFTGPGTDLTIGLLPGVRWEGGGMTSSEGVPYLPNIPTEEHLHVPRSRANARHGHLDPPAARLRSRSAGAADAIRGRPRGARSTPTRARS